MCRLDELHALVGAWRLMSWENRAEDGQISHPMGSNPVGYLIYTPDSAFSVMISRQGRRSFDVGDLLGGTVAEKVHAVESFVAYGGRYTLEGDRVTHHVELSLFPNWVGTDQQRMVELTGDQLVLSAGPLLLAGKEQTARLVWARLPHPLDGS